MINTDVNQLIEIQKEMQVLQSELRYICHLIEQASKDLLILKEKI